MLDRTSETAEELHRADLRHRLGRSLKTLAFAALFVALMAGGAGLLHWRAAATAGVDPTPPLPVKTVEIELQDSFTVLERFAGRLEAARQASIAFERDGLVVAVLVEEGQQVEAGDVLARLDTDPLNVRRAGLEAQLRQREAERDLAEVTAQRQKTLNERGHVSAQAYDEARLSAVALDAAADGIRAEIDAVDIDLRKSEIRAPFDGQIADRFVDEGQVVGAGTRVVRILESGRPQARIGLTPTAARDLAVGQTIELRAAGQIVEAQIVALRPDLALGTRTVTALLELEETAPVPFGDVVEIALPRRIESQGAWVPLSALAEGRKGLWVLSTVADGPEGSAVARTAVEIQTVSDGRAFVTGALPDRLRVIVSGSNRTVPGQRVRIAAGQ